MATFRYWRFQPTAVRGPATDTMQLSEFWFLNVASLVGGATITGVGDANAVPWETADAVGDGQTTTKWANINGLVGYALWDFGTATTATGYRWATGDDAPERDPTAWTIEGSADNSSWTLVDTITGFTGTTSRQTYNSDFTFPTGPPVLPLPVAVQAAQPWPAF